MAEQNESDMILAKLLEKIGAACVAASQEVAKTVQNRIDKQSNNVSSREPEPPSSDA